MALHPLPLNVAQFVHGDRTYRITVEAQDEPPPEGMNGEALLKEMGLARGSRPTRSLAIRSFTIRDAVTGERVFDSKEELERLLSGLVPGLFDGRPVKGPERRSVTLGRVNGRLFAYVRLDPLGGTAVLDLTDPHHPEFVDYRDQRIRANGA